METGNLRQHNLRANAFGRNGVLFGNLLPGNKPHRLGCSSTIDRPYLGFQRPWQTFVNQRPA